MIESRVHMTKVAGTFKIDVRSSFINGADDHTFIR